MNKKIHNAHSLISWYALLGSSFVLSPVKNYVILMLLISACIAYIAFNKPVTTLRGLTPFVGSVSLAMIFPVPFVQGFPSLIRLLVVLAFWLLIALLINRLLNRALSHN